MSFAQYVKRLDTQNDIMAVKPNPINVSLVVRVIVPGFWFTVVNIEHFSELMLVVEKPEIVEAKERKLKSPAKNTW